MGRRKTVRGIRVVLARNIRMLRAAQQLTQESLAEKADLDRTYVGRTERAETNPTVEAVERLAKALGVSVQRLFEEGS